MTGTASVGNLTGTPTRAEYWQQHPVSAMMGPSRCASRPRDLPERPVQNTAYHSESHLYIHLSFACMPIGHQHHTISHHVFRHNRQQSRSDWQERNLHFRFGRTRNGARPVCCLELVLTAHRRTVNRAKRRRGAKRSGNAAETIRDTGAPTRQFPRWSAGERPNERRGRGEI